MKFTYRNARVVTVVLAASLFIPLTGGNAFASTGVPTSASPAISTAITINDIDSMFNQSDSSAKRKIKAVELSTRLANVGYVKEEMVHTPQGSAYIYTLRDRNITVSYLVPTNPETMVLDPDSGGGDRKINVGWDNGPRIYMTGTDFWNLGKVGLQEVCGKLPWGSAACNKLVERLWTGNLTGPGRILNDGRCWDLSQTLNVGWRPAPPEKCA